MGGSDVGGLRAVPRGIGAAVVCAGLLVPLGARPVGASGVCPSSTFAVTVVIPPGGSLSLLDAHRQEAAAVAMAGEGTYRVLGARITFTPLAAFAGAATPVAYLVQDAYGQSAQAWYAPVVAAAAPLPGTGVPVLDLLALAAGLAGAGAFLVLAGRRRHC